MKAYIKVFLLSILSALLLVLTLPPFNFYVCAWVGFAPLFYLVLKGDKYNLLSILFAFVIIAIISGFFEFNCILKYRKSTFAILWSLYTIIFSLYGIIIILLVRKIKSYILRILIIPGMWIVLLKIFSFTFIGYHWGEQFCAYSQNNLYLLQVISIIGTMGLTYIILLYNASISLLVAFRNIKAISLFIASNFILAGVVFYGYTYINVSSNQNQLDKVSKLKVVIIQPGISGEPGFEQVTPEISYDEIGLACIRKFYMKTSTFINLCKRARERQPDLIIWPQFRLPIDISKHSKIVKFFYKELGVPLLIGTFVYRNGNVANVSLYIDNKGNVKGERMLVQSPPFREISMAYGKEFKPLSINIQKLDRNIKVGPLICYEDMSGDGAQEMIRNGAEILVVQTNDGIFQKTRLPEMHLRRDVFRAIENRRWVLRAATTGISAIISPQGKIIKSAGKKKMDMITDEIPLAYFRRNI